MRFRFALQPLLDARERAEDDARANLLAASAALARERSRIASLRTGLTRATHALRRSPAGRTALVEIELLLAAIGAAETAARAVTERESAARHALAEARRARRQVEALRDRALGAHRAAAERREQREIEESNNARHNAATLFASSFHNSSVS
jgi:flagellar FliJ protein